MNNANLIHQAFDFSAALLTRPECDVLWQQASAAMHSGSYQEAFATVEALLCQADRDGVVVPDLLPNPMLTPIGKGRIGSELEMIRGFLDRVESLNTRIQRGWTCGV